MSNKLTALACDDSYCDHVPFKDGDLYDREEVDEFVKELEQQNSALLAQIEELRAAMLYEAGETRQEFSVPDDVNLYLEVVAAKTPQQSLSSLKSSVEEETIERCEEAVAEYYGIGAGSIAIYGMPRKYKEEG